MPLKPHPTDPDKMVYVSRQYDIPQLQGLTTPQRPWVGLTDGEIDAIYLQHHNQYDECESPNWGYERAIEAKLKEKNT